MLSQSVVQSDEFLGKADMWGALSNKSVLSIKSEIRVFIQ
jgi:hypothetical protein